jgi:MFS superfamily sulfate permease-like transporter
VSASTTRSAVARASGARSQVAGLVAAGLVLCFLVAGSGLVENLPTVTLAAIVIAAGIRLFDLEAIRWLMAVRSSELLLSLSATVGVVVIGVLDGIVIAIVLSLGNFVRKVWRPYDAVLGRVAGRTGYHDIARHPAAEQEPGLLLFRFDAPLFFANAEHFVRRVRLAVSQAPAPVNRVVIAGEPISDIDTSGYDQLNLLMDELDRHGIVLAFAELKGPAKDRLVRYGLFDRIGADHFHSTVESAIAASRRES